MMSNLPLVSFIVPVYKVEKYIDNCVRSVLEQTYSRWELILVDDGSPDRCGVICDEYASMDCRITVLHTQNAGLSSARNRALDCPPKGEYVTFLDSDDFWHKDFLQNMVNLALNFNADLAQCEFVKGSSSVFPVLDEIVSVDVSDNHSVFLLGQANIVMWGKLYRLSLFDGIRMPVGLYNEDDWTTWKLYYRAKKIVVSTEKLYYYTANPFSIMARLGKKPDLRFVNAYEERIGFFRKTGEKDLEHCSHLQLCKALVLTYQNSQLSHDERKQVKSRFEVSWKVLKDSPYIASKFKILFCLFHFIPKLASKLANKSRSK